MRRTEIGYADYSCNPIRARYTTVDGVVKQGWACVRVSPGCTNCYAATLNRRLGTGLDYTVPNMARVDTWLDERVIQDMLRFRHRGPHKNGRGRPVVFVCDMTDLFGEWVTDEMRDRVFAAAALRQDVDWLLLTKRPERMREYLTSPNSEREDAIGEAMEALTGRPVSGDAPDDSYDQLDDLPLPNVWLGVSAENQAALEQRVGVLSLIPAAWRWLSCEPLLGEIWIEELEFLGPSYGVFPGGDPRRFSPDEEVNTAAEIMAWKAACDEWNRGAGTDRGPGCAAMGDGSVWTGTGFGLGTYTPTSPIDWLVVGGESGPGRRPCEVEWIADIVRQCDQAGVPVFVKQGSAFRPGQQGDLPDAIWQRKEFPHVADR